MTQAALGLFTGLAAAGVGVCLHWLPSRLSLAGQHVATFRVFFAGVVVLLLFMLTRVVRLPKIGEPGVRHAAGAALTRIQEAFGRLSGS